MSTFFRTTQPNKGYVFFDSGFSTLTSVNNGCNAYGNVGDDNGTNNTWKEMSYNKDYLIKIGGVYCRISIGSSGPTPDIELWFSGGFTEHEHHNTIRLEEQGLWNSKTVTVKNSFNSGKVIIDDVEENSGIVKSLGTPTFPHILEAKTNQLDDGFKQVFQEWTKDGNNHENSLEASIDADNALYTASFLDQYNVTFQNNFISAGNGGIIEVNDSEKNSKTSAYPVLDNRTIKARALSQAINGIAYTFSHWSHSGGTNSTKTFTVTDDHKDYIAYFTGKPSNSYRNLHFNTSDPVGTPIKVMWNQHTNSNVTLYKIYRKTKYGSPTLIKTVNRTSASNYTYTDNDYSITNNRGSNYLLRYDVRAHYSTEDSYSDDDWLAVYGELMFKTSEESEKQELAIGSFEYGISNYPNPYNPATTISYQVKEIGNVNITVYDALGREVRVLVNNIKQPGSYSTKFNGSNLTSGIYFYTMQINDFMVTKKMLLAK